MPCDESSKFGNNIAQAGFVNFGKEWAGRGDTHHRARFTATQAFSPDDGDVKLFGRNQGFDFID